MKYWLKNFNNTKDLTLLDEQRVRANGFFHAEFQQLQIIKSIIGEPERQNLYNYRLFQGRFWKNGPNIFDCMGDRVLRTWNCWSNISLLHRRKLFKDWETNKTYTTPMNLSYSYLRGFCRWYGDMLIGLGINYYALKQTSTQEVLKYLFCLKM